MATALWGRSSVLMRLSLDFFEEKGIFYLLCRFLTPRSDSVRSSKTYKMVIINLWVSDDRSIHPFDYGILVQTPICVIEIDSGRSLIFWRAS